MKRQLFSGLLPLLLMAACLPPAKTACQTSSDCAHGRVCIEGTCNFPGQDAGAMTEVLAWADGATGEASVPVPDVATEVDGRDVASDPALDVATEVNGRDVESVPGPDVATDIADIASRDIGRDSTDDSQTKDLPIGDDAGTMDGANGSSAAAEQANPSCAAELICADGLSCCHRLDVPGGTFSMGRSVSGSDACPEGVTCYNLDLPEHSAKVSTFALDAFETTVGRFRVFVQHLETHPGWQPATGAGRHPLIPKSGWNEGRSATLPSSDDLKAHLKCYTPHQTWTTSPGANENKPINCINWYEAFAFCAWDGGRLPTEAEWEYAAAGGAENRLYPWGDTIVDCEHANVDLGLHCAGSSVAPLPVGQTRKGNGRWGHRDLTGNVWEWVLDLNGDYTNDACLDCADLSEGNYHVCRGGCFGSFIETFLVTMRGFDAEGAAYNGMGVRCARDVP
jgi:sulfatase modifying factor 1